MRTSHYLLLTQKETPGDAELISHRLMLRAGLIRKLAAGIYTWLPLGLKVLQKIEAIVREEMNKSGALELLMPAVQPAELWEETGRWNDFGNELLKIADQNKRQFCFGPTHEEVITDIVRREIRSYKQLPLNLYQIQTKFRDEIRPRYGVMRGREFLMKDAYSFHKDHASLEETYQIMFNTYCRIFDKIQLNYRPVLADTGAIGGKVSHEFHVLAHSGEDEIFYSDESNYAANVELAEAIPTPPSNHQTELLEKEKIATPGVTTIKEVCEFLNLVSNQTVKTLIVHGNTHEFVALCLRGDHELNTAKAEKNSLIKRPLKFASDEEILKKLNLTPGSIGPISLGIPVIVDRSAAVLENFVCGANEKGMHYRNVNWKRDVGTYEISDLRKVVEGDPSPDGKGTLRSCRGIEVGHIFQLGDKYSKAMNATVLDETGQAIPLIMGCYGLGVSRVVAAAIEQNHDEKGIIWPDAIAPFQIALIPINMQRSLRLKEAAEATYLKLKNAGFDVLFDDREQRPGVMFAEMDLLGIPNRLVLSEKGLDSGTIEYKSRREEKPEEIKLADLMGFLDKKTNPLTIRK